MSFCNGRAHLGASVSIPRLILSSPNKKRPTPLAEVPSEYTESAPLVPCEGWFGQTQKRQVGDGPIGRVLPSFLPFGSCLGASVLMNTSHQAKSTAGLRRASVHPPGVAYRFAN